MMSSVPLIIHPLCSIVCLHSRHGSLAHARLSRWPKPLSAGWAGSGIVDHLGEQYPGSCDLCGETRCLEGLRSVARLRPYHLRVGVDAQGLERSADARALRSELLRREATDEDLNQARRAEGELEDLVPTKRARVL